LQIIVLIVVVNKKLIHVVISAAIQDAWVLRRGAAMRESVENTGDICQTAVEKCCHIPPVELHPSQESL
jgi:hypothetical protein